MAASENRTLSVSPTQHQRVLMEHAVSNGDYRSDTEILQAALKLWENVETDRQAEIALLKRAYDEGIASGPGRVVSADEFLAELKAEARGRG